MKKPDVPSRAWLLRSIYPRSSSTRLPFLFAAVLGVGVGLGAYTFSYAKGWSYFGTEPSACANCHIMEPQFAGWQKGSHHAVARCIDCHLPVAFIPKYVAKAENGYRHGKLFTTQTFEEPITVKAAGKEILQANCQRCHADLVHGMLGIGDYDVDGRSGEAERARQGASCISCHWTVGHGERAGLGGPARGNEPSASGAAETDTD